MQTSFFFQKFSDIQAFLAEIEIKFRSTVIKCNQNWPKNGAPNNISKYLHCGQPCTSTRIEICPFHSCGLNLRYMASNNLTSLRTVVFWSVLPARVCRIFYVYELRSADDALHLMLNKSNY